MHKSIAICPILMLMLAGCASQQKQPLPSTESDIFQKIIASAEKIEKEKTFLEPQLVFTENSLQTLTSFSWSGPAIPAVYALGNMLGYTVTISGSAMQPLISIKEKDSTFIEIFEKIGKQLGKSGLTLNESNRSINLHIVE